MKDVVFEINNALRRFGREAIQESTIPGRGKVFGYRPQYIIDAVNSVLGPENWRYEVLSHSVEKGEKVTVAWVMVRLFVRLPDGNWMEKGQHFGHAHVTMGAIGDALKAATTDALGKCFSTLSIGRDAYSGSLARNNGQPIPVKERPTAGAAPPAPVKDQPEAGSMPPATNAAPEPEQNTESPEGRLEEISPQELGIPPIRGVTFYVEDATGTVIASGATYQNKNLLRNAGFTFDKATKRWVSYLPGTEPPVEGEEGNGHAGHEDIPF